MDGQHNLVGHSLAGRYKLLKLIGQGGMGSVYQAADQQMSNRVVAVKVLAPHLVSDEKQVMRFEQEARAANQLRHPNTISVLDFGRDPNGHIFMVIEFLTGETLTAVLRRGRVETAGALYMMRQVCKSLAEAHSKGIIHRDLKPDNIFVCEIYGEKDFIKVIDFGIAKFLEAGGQELTQAGKMFGTPRYLSPEQAQGLPLTPASDLYALGVILFEMLCGRPPFVAEDPIAVAIKHVQEAPPTFAEVAPDVYVPEELDHLVFKLLAKKPAARFQSAEEVVHAIDGILSGGMGGRHGVAHFTPAAALTPARPKTIPPPSSDEVEKTRALDSLVPVGADPDRTMALDQLAALPAANERTLALDTATAQAALQAAAANKAGAVAKAPARPAAQSGPSSRNLLLLLIVALLAVGAVMAAMVGQDESSGPKPLPVSVAQAAPAPVAEAQPAPQPETPPKPATPEPTKPEPAPVPAKPPEYKVTLTSVPPEAEVTLDGLVLGKTPFDMKLVADAPNQKVVLKLAEHEDKEIETATMLTAAMAGVTTLPAELKPKPKAAPKKAKKPKESDWE